MLVLVVVGLFLLLTRTQAGRDVVAGQAVAAFNRTYQGHLEIGRLRGTLVRDLHASDVRLYDPAGRLVADVDSVVLRPTWRSLFRRAFVADEILLFRPRLALVRADSGTWNLAAALAPRRVRTHPPNPLDLSAADIQIREGTVTTRNEGEAPEAVRAGRVFDYTNVTLTGLDADLSLEVRRSFTLLRLPRLDGTLVEPGVEIETLAGRLHFAGDELSVESLRLVTGASRIEGALTLDGLGSPTEPQALDLDLADGRVAAAELRRLVPAAPLAADLRVSGRARGPLSDLAAEDLVLATGQTRIETAGRLRGLPDSLAFDLTFPSATARSSDLAALVPSLSLPAEIARLGTVTWAGDLDGALRPAARGWAVRLDGDLVATTKAGRADGLVQLAVAPGRAPVYRLDAEIEAADPSVVFADPRLAGHVQGRLFAERLARADSAGQPVTAFRFALGPSSLAGRTADSVAVEGTLRGPRLTALIVLRQGASRLRGQLDLDGSDRRLGFEGELTAFDLQRLLPGVPATRVTGPLRVDLQGTTLADLRADLDARFDDAALELATGWEALPTGPLRLTVNPPGTSDPRFIAASDVLDAELSGPLDLASATALGQQWGAAFARTAAIEFDKPRGGARRPDEAPASPADRPAQPFRLTARLLRPDLLRAWVPGLPDLAPGATITAEGRIGGDSLRAEGTLTAPYLRFDTFALDRPAVDWSARGGFAPVLTETLTFRAEARADTLRLGERFLDDARATAVLDRRRLDLLAEAGTFGEGLGALHVEGSLALLPDRNRLALDSLRLAIAGFEWTTDGPQQADLYADAITLDGLTFVRAEADQPQRVTLRGALSTAPTDTLYAAVRGVEVGEIAAAAEIRPFRSDLGGRLDADLAVADLLRQPVLSGKAVIPRLTLGDRLLGRVDAASRFVPGAEAVEVSLEVTRPDAATALPQGLRLEENDLGIAGRVRFPARAPDGTRDAGLLDLDLTARRADLFFFDLLFPAILADARGFAEGSGRITGDFSYPIFEAELEAHEAAVAIPRFGLGLAAGGCVRVDRAGIHLVDVVLTDASGGTGSVAGSVLFNDYRFFSLDLRADLREVEIINVPDARDLPFFGHIRASGTATVTGPLDRVLLRSANAVTTPDSEILIPIEANAGRTDRGFLVYADSLGRVPEQTRRTSLIGRRPDAERTFTEGLEMSLNVTAPPGSTVRLLFDPDVGEELRAEGEAELQLVLREGAFRTFGAFTASGGDYRFTAGEVFVRRFEIAPGGVLVWEGDPLDARLNLTANYRTRASLAGLGLAGLEGQRVPLVIRANLGGRLQSPLVALTLDLDTDTRAGASTEAAVEALRPLLNDPDRQALYATSVLLTGTFLLAPVEDPTAAATTFTEAADDLFFTSLSQLVSSRLNLFLSQALASDDVEILFGLQPGEQFQDFDLTYGVALRLLDERLVIRGEGVYQQLENRPATEGLQGEVAVEIRLTPAVALEVFYRRESELLGGTNVGTTPYGAYGAGLSYETEFSSWRRVLQRLLGREPEAALSR